MPGTAESQGMPAADVGRSHGGGGLRKEASPKMAEPDDPAFPGPGKAEDLPLEETPSRATEGGGRRWSAKPTLPAVGTGHPIKARSAQKCGSRERAPWRGTGSNAPSGGPEAEPPPGSRAGGPGAAPKILQGGRVRATARAAEGTTDDQGPTEEKARQSIPEDCVMPLVHFYRAEITRGNVWRVRMDATTNWAIGAAVATISFTFSRPDAPHLLIPLGGVIVFLLMCIEGRRYRFYDVWRARTRLLEAHLMVPMLMFDAPILQGRWREQLAEDLLMPSYKMSFWKATGSRLRRNYIWVFLILLGSWLLRVLTEVDFQNGHVGLARDLSDFPDVYAALGYSFIPSWLVLSGTVSFHAFLITWMLAIGQSPDPDVFIYKRARSVEEDWPL